MLSYLYQRFTPYEWLLTNRKGGYALGTAFLTNVRKYHGLLIAGDGKGKRYHLLACLEEVVTFPSGLSYQLDTNFYRDVVYPQGYQFIKEYFYLPYPVFYFYCPKTEAGVFLIKSLRFHRDKNILLLTYENISSYPFKLLLRPRLTFRDHHYLTFANSWDWFEEEISSNFAFIAKDSLALFCYSNKDGFIKDPIFYYGVYYPLEEMRGYPSYEDHFSPFRIEVELNPGEKLNLFFSDEPLKDLQETLEEITARYEGAPKIAPTKPQFEDKDVLLLLNQMVKAFLLRDNVCAGYPWFYAWGRDTFIGLPALFYDPDAIDTCYQIFDTYGKYIQGGLVPNLIGDLAPVNYNSVDASLWFGIRIFEYLDKFREDHWHRIGFKELEDRKTKLLSLVEEVIRGYLCYSEHPFFVDPEDGLICIPESSGRAFTWMDVLLDGKPLTPRYEKPIEVQFLWYNLLMLAKDRLPKEKVEELGILGLVEKIPQSLRKYYNGELFADTLYRGEPVYEIRPNFVIALSLPYVPFERDELLRAVEIVRRELLTPYGLRSLSPRHPHFKRKYFGSQYQRDLAYHNGTVWVWLIYPYALLLKKVLTREEYLAEARMLIYPFIQLLKTGKLSSIPELYDGDQPYYPKGAPAQFWSTAAVYLLAREIFS